MIPNGEVIKFLLKLLCNKMKNLTNEKFVNSDQTKNMGD